MTYQNIMPSDVERVKIEIPPQSNYEDSDFDSLFDHDHLHRHPSGKRILVVDDQIYNIKAIKSILYFVLKIDLRYVDSCDNGMSAFTKFAESFDFSKNESLYDVVLMDCNMPFMDGYTSTKLIRNFLYRRGLRSLPEQPIVSA